MAPNTQQMLCVSCCYLSHPQGQTPISSNNDTGDVQRFGVQVVSKVMLPSVEGLGFELKTVRDLSPRAWPPRYRTSPGNSTRVVSFPDMTHYGMDPQKTQLHHWSVFSEENPEASQGEGNESWTGAAPFRWRQSLPGDTKCGKAYLDTDRKCDVWFIKKKVDLPDLQWDVICSSPKPPRGAQQSASSAEMEGEHSCVRKSGEKFLGSESRAGKTVTQIVGLSRQTWGPGQKLDHSGSRQCCCLR